MCGLAQPSLKIIAAGCQEGEGMKLLFQVEFILQGSLSSIFKAFQLSQSGIFRKSAHIMHMYIQTSAHIMSIPDESLQIEHIHVLSRQIQAKNIQLALHECLLFIAFSSYSRHYSFPLPSAPNPLSSPQRRALGISWLLRVMLLWHCGYCSQR